MRREPLTVASRSGASRSRRAKIARLPKLTLQFLRPPYFSCPSRGTTRGTPVAIAPLRNIDNEKRLQPLRARLVITDERRFGSAITANRYFLAVGRSNSAAHDYWPRTCTLLLRPPAASSITSLRNRFKPETARKARSPAKLARQTLCAGADSVSLAAPARPNAGRASGSARPPPSGLRQKALFAQASRERRDSFCGPTLQISRAVRSLD